MSRDIYVSDYYSVRLRDIQGRLRLILFLAVVDCCDATDSNCDCNATLNVILFIACNICNLSFCNPCSCQYDIDCKIRSID